MVWGMISSAGVRHIVRFHDNINASIYKKILRHNAFPHRDSWNSNIYSNNTPCHKDQTVLSFLEEEGIVVMKWPPQSSDINPKENLVTIIGEKAQNRNPQNIDDLWGFLKEEWVGGYIVFFLGLISIFVVVYLVCFYMWLRVLISRKVAIYSDGGITLLLLLGFLGLRFKLVLLVLLWLSWYCVGSYPRTKCWWKIKVVEKNENVVRFCTKGLMAAWSKDVYAGMLRAS